MTTGLGDSRIYQNDVGTELYIETGVDLTTATVARLYVQKPDGTQVTWTAAAALNPDPDTDPTLGLTCLKYVLTASDTTQVGSHMAHGYVEMPNGKWTTNLTAFRIWERFVS